MYSRPTNWFRDLEIYVGKEIKNKYGKCSPKFLIHEDQFLTVKQYCKDKSWATYIWFPVIMKDLAPCPEHAD